MEFKEIQKRISMCDVTYHVLGQSDRSAMPLGNGELAVSAWVTEDGILHCYLSRSDALSELDRTIKLGEIQISFSPVQFTKEAYTQKLCLTKGQIQITGRDGLVKLWVARDAHCLCITGQFCKPVTISATYHTWRTLPFQPLGEFQFQHGIHESADIVQHEKIKLCFITGIRSRSSRMLRSFKTLAMHRHSFPICCKTAFLEACWMSSSPNAPFMFAY